MRQEYVVEILPDGRAALRIAIVHDDRYPPAPVEETEQSPRGVYEIPMTPPGVDDEVGAVVWKM